MSEKQVLEFLLECNYDTLKEYQAEFEQVGGNSIEQMLREITLSKKTMTTEPEISFNFGVSLQDLERLRILTKLFSIKDIKVLFNDTGDIEYITNLTQEIYMGMKGLKDEQDYRRGRADC
jgi:hypothetical protein